jgi:CO dehydrogenase/acetyl-CoA synthase epsilon subunit
MTMDGEQEAKEALWEHAKKFIRDQQITCAETVYQTDRVIENAYEFIQGVADIVGYLEVDDDDDL